MEQENKTLKYIKKFFLEGSEWESIKQISKLKRYDSPIIIISHEVGHALWAYKSKNLKAIYITKSEEDNINGGIVYTKRKFKKRSDDFSFTIMGLLASCKSIDELKLIAIASYDLYTISDVRYFSYFDKYLSNSMKFYISNKEKINNISNKMLEYCKSCPDRIVKITNEKFIEFMKE